MDFPIKVTDQLGLHIKSLRKARGLSQTDLGKLIGVGQARVAEIEAAPGLVNLEQLLRIFRALDCDLLLRSDGAGAHPEAEVRAIAAERPSQYAKVLHRQGNEGAW